MADPAEASDAELRRIIDLRALDLLDTAAEERFDRITRLAQRLFDVPIALVSLVDEDRQWFKSRVGLDVTETPRELAFCAHAIEGDDLLHVPDARADSRFDQNPLVTGDPRIRFYAGFPIAAPSGSKLGTLCVIGREPRDLSPDDEQTLGDLAAMVEQEIAASHMAATDPLTQLYNRRGFELVARQVLSLAARLDRPASLLFVDLDGMKQINDEAGHGAGDRALQATAKLLTETLRSSDVIARLGGDEFCVLFSGSSAIGATDALARLHAATAAHNATSGVEFRLSLSTGLAEWASDSDESLETLLARADELMYRDKQGRAAADPTRNRPAPAAPRSADR